MRNQINLFIEKRNTLTQNILNSNKSVKNLHRNLSSGMLQKLHSGTGLPAVERLEEIIFSPNN